MADPSLLASIISGTNPMAPTMLGSYQGAQLSNAALDPNYGHNEGIFGALAKTLAGFRGGNMLQQGVQQTTAANQAAMPDLAKLLATPDPYSALASGNYDPIAAARLLQGATPETVANARKIAAEAQLAGMNIAGFQRAANAAGGATGPLASVPAGKAAGAALTGAPTSIADMTTGRQPLVTGAETAPDPVAAILSMPADQRGQALARLNPAQKAALALKLRQMQGTSNAPRS